MEELENMETPEVQLPENVTVCDIQFRTSSKVYFFDPGEIAVNANDDVIIETARGLEFGLCVRGNHVVSSRDIVPPLRPVVRVATEQDKVIDAENRQKEKRAYDICLQKIEELGLEMQLVSAEYAFDASKVLFFFTADGRVDFRELVKNLASQLRTRIELRQIGVRDKAKMVGGLGICGRPFCCREFLDDFQPVSIKMAKTQNLSLNPTKISGTCGRLMCCLIYEQEAYEDLLRTSPKTDSLVDTPEGRGTITEVNLLKQTCKVRMEKQPDDIITCKNCDICVLRSGKAKKTDAPIPDDYAPISGNREPAEASSESVFSTYLEDIPVKKPRSVVHPEKVPAEKTKPVQPQQKQTETETSAEEKPSGSRRHRNRGKNKPQTAVPEQGKKENVSTSHEPAPAVKPAKRQHNNNAKPKEAQPAKPVQKTPEVKPASEGTGEPKSQKPKNNHRFHHRRRPSGPKSGNGVPPQA